MCLLKKYAAAYKKRFYERRYRKEVKKRFAESEKLSPEYDFLEIDKEGYLLKGYPVFMTMSLTFDKVEAAGFIRGDQLMKEMPELGWAPILMGINEINERAGRKRIFSKLEIENEKRSHVKEKAGRLRTC